MKGICSTVLALLLLFLSGTATAHPDLLLRIEQLTAQLESEPLDVELRILRGELYRRHGDWSLSAADLQKARALAPGHDLLDWYEGRLAVDSGDFVNANMLLSRYLDTHPDHAAAWHQRARAGTGLGNHLHAASDFSRSINTGERPGPVLFRSLVLSYVAAGVEHSEFALAAVDDGLSRFPSEISLLGLGTDLSLAQSKTNKARVYLDSISPRILELPQWQFRLAVQSCLEGKNDAAGKRFSSLLQGLESHNGSRAGTWDPPLESIRVLASNPLPDVCAATSWKTLRKQQP